MVQSQDDPASQQREIGKQQEGLRNNQCCKYRGSESYRRSPRRKRRLAVQPNEQSDRTLREVNRSKITVHSRGGRVIEDVKANMLQGIMQSATESDDDDEENDEDEAKKPATSDKQKRSSRDKERRENKRKLESKLKDELSIVSTATEVQ